MRTFERPAMLRRAIRGVVSQTFDDWQLVVVNNGGDAGDVRRAVSDAVADRPGAPDRIEVVDTGARLGMEAASNAGLRRRESEFFVVHDDDDTWEPEFLSRCVSHLDEHPDCSGVVTAVTRVWERAVEGRLETVRTQPFVIKPHWLTYDRLIAYNVFPPVAAVFRRRLLDDLGLFDESLPVLGDWEFNMRVVENGRLCMLEEPLANYHARTPDSDARSQGTVTGSEDLHVQVREVLRQRWDGVPALGHPGMSKGELSREVHRGLLAEAEARRNRPGPTGVSRVSRRVSRAVRRAAGASLRALGLRR